jgi:hypothetical protein
MLSGSLAHNQPSAKSQQADHPETIKAATVVATKFYKWITRASKSSIDAHILAAETKAKVIKSQIDPSPHVVSPPDTYHQDGEMIIEATEAAAIDAPLHDKPVLSDTEFLLIMGASLFIDETGRWLGHRGLEYIEALADLIRYRSVFRLNYHEPLEAIRGLEYVVELKQSHTAPINCPVGRYSELEKKEICHQIAGLIKAGILVDTRSSWSNRLVMVAKAGTSDLRMCMDFRALNKLTVSLSGSLPRAQEVIDASFQTSHKIYSILTLPKRITN